MKEDKFIDSLFEAAKNEAPKTSYKMVAFKFSSTVGAAGWLTGAKAAFLNNVYLNSIISVLTVGTVATTAYVVLDNSETQAQDNAAKEITYTEWFDDSIQEIERLNYSPFQNQTPEANLQLGGSELNSLGNTAENTLGNTMAEMNLNNSSYRGKAKNKTNRTAFVTQKLKHITAGLIPLSVLNKTIVYGELHKLEVLEKNYKEVLRPNGPIEHYFDFNKNSGQEILGEMVAYFEMSGISATVTAKYNPTDGSIKRLKMDLSDNEGYIQRVVSIGFDVMEIRWKSDSNGYPYELKIAWDNGELMDIDLRDHRAPIYKYIDRN